MIVNVLRHGIAEERRPGLDDTERALTAEGREKLRAVLKLAVAAGMTPDVIISSPLVRAMQTAEIAAKVLKSKKDVLRTSGLAPRATPEETWDELRTQANRGEILIVGHEPHLGRLAALLLGAPALRVDFKKGGIVRVRIDRVVSAPRGELEWMLVPRLARSGGGR